MNLPVPDPPVERRNDDASDVPRKAAPPAAGDGHPGAQGRPPVTRRMLDEIFGDVLPTVTGDELDNQVGQAGRDADRDQWYRDTRPPHHD